MDIQQEVERWKQRATDPVIAAQLDELLNAGNQKGIDDAFFQELEFGTGGLRGILGPGTNRMNIYTVGKATQGLADYINATDTTGSPSVALCRDSRHNGELFVQTVAGILAANGISVHVYPRIEPTPALSFATRDLGCNAGINITASHNPSIYNGYKVYGADGCQITSQAAVAIQNAISGIDIFDDVKNMSFDQACEQGRVDSIPESTLDRFIDAVYAANMADPNAISTQLKLVYTPLNGTGLECMKRILPRIGVMDVTTVPEQENPDGSFPTCPYPNPEIREALRKGIELCQQVHPDLLLATDPDADRVGIAVESEGEYVLLTGNEVGTLLLDYIARMRMKQNTMPKDPICVSTIVSTVMIDAIAQEYGIQICRTLTGFKYIGELIGQLEANDQENNLTEKTNKQVDRFIFGFEESYGYLSANHVRDKDSINASMLICQMAQHYKAQGMNLVQAMETLYKRYGYYRNRTVSVSFPGADGAKKMTLLMDGLRANPPSNFNGLAVQEVVDYVDGFNGLPKANVLEFRLPDTNKIIFRPSGTEPKIKSYLFSRGETAESANAVLGQLEDAARTVLD